MKKYVQQITEKVAPLTVAIINHPLQSGIQSKTDLRIFMNSHVFAVWDFMCLLKELHTNIVSTSAPWMPPKDALSANLISGILSEEEGDETPDGGVDCHYNIYLAAMRQIGADTAPICKLLELLQNGMGIEQALDVVTSNVAVKQFVLSTFSFFDQEAHQIAAAFVYGREGLTLSMFEPILAAVDSKQNSSFDGCDILQYYLKRHIDLDNDDHFPKALQMLENLIEGDQQKAKEAEIAAVRSIEARIKFFDQLHAEIQSSKQTESRVVAEEMV